MENNKASVGRKKGGLLVVAIFNRVVSADSLRRRYFMKCLKEWKEFVMQLPWGRAFQVEETERTKALW